MIFCCKTPNPPLANQAGQSTAKEVHKVVCSAFADEDVAQFIDESFVFWASLGDSSGTASVARKLGAKRYPFFGVVHSSALTGKSSTGVVLQCTILLHGKNWANTGEMVLISLIPFFLISGPSSSQPSAFSGCYDEASS